MAAPKQPQVLTIEPDNELVFRGKIMHFLFLESGLFYLDLVFYFGVWTLFITFFYRFFIAVLTNQKLIIILN